MRITDKILNNLIDELNEEINGSAVTWTKEEGSIKGMYTLDCSYGGYALQRYANSGGGVSDISSIYGRYTKKELYERIKAFLGGYRLAKKMI